MRIVPLLLILFLLPLTMAALTPEDRMDVIRDLQQGHADHALELLQPGASASNRDAETEQLLCRVALQLERWNDAVSACEKAVALGDNNSNNHRILLCQENLSKATILLLSIINMPMKRTRYLD